MKSRFKKITWLFLYGSCRHESVSQLFKFTSLSEGHFKPKEWFICDRCMSLLNPTHQITIQGYLIDSKLGHEILKREKNEKF